MSKIKFEALSLPRAISPSQIGEESIVPWWKRDYTLFSPFGWKEKKRFYELLEVLLQAGLTLSDALVVLEEQYEKPVLKSIVSRLIKGLQAGGSLSESMKTMEEYFGVFEIQSILMAEKSGMLNSVLIELTRYFESRLRIRRKLIQVFSYPSIVILLAVGVVSFMLTQVVPMFEDVFKMFDADLPFITRKVLDISAFIRTYLGLIIGGLFSLGILFYVLRNNQKWIAFYTHLILKVPILGALLLKIQLARFCITMATLLKSKVKLDDALDLSHEIVAFYPIQSLIPDIKKQVIAGGTLYAAIQNQKIFPFVFKQIVKVGERTATLDTMFENLGRNLEQESELEISNLTNILEPLLVVILGGVIGFILLSMYLPMFQLSQTVAH